MHDIDFAPARPPAPTEATPREAVMGDNKPPEALSYDPEVHASMAKKVDAFNEVAGEWLDLAKIETKEQAENLGDFIRGASGIKKAIENARADAKRPWQMRADAAYAAFNGLVVNLDAMVQRLKPMANDWIRRENARIQKEKDEAAAQARRDREAAEEKRRQALLNNDVGAQVAAEKEAKAAEKAEAKAGKVERATIGSATGGGRVLSTRRTKQVRITDINRLFRHYRERPEVGEVLTRLAQVDVRAAGWDGVPPPGAEVYETESVA